MPDGRLVFDTEIDLDGYDKGLKEIEGRSAGAGDVIKGILGADVIKEGAQALWNAGKYAVNLASDLEEVQNVVDVTFGEGAGKIETFAKAAGRNFGMSELSAKKYNGTMGAMLKSMGLAGDEVMDMSTSLTGLTGDIASFYNLDHDTAFEKIRSGISGETEPLKQLGINMSVANLEAFALQKGIKKTYDELSEAERVQLRYSYIMEATADAQGDYVRTSDGFANQLRTLQTNVQGLAAKLGGVLLPAATDVLQTINEIFGGEYKTEIEVSVSEATENIEDLKDGLDDIKENYIRRQMTITVDYQRAQGLIDDFERLTLTEGSIKKNAASLQTLSAALTETYPELAQYVGEDGIIALEADALRKLVDEYTEMNRVTAASQYVSDVEANLVNAQVEYAVLKQESIEAEEALAGAQEQLTALETAWAAIQGFSGMSIAADTLSTESVQQMADALNAYILAAGGLDGVDLTGYEGLFGNDGLVEAGADAQLLADLIAEVAAAQESIEPIGEMTDTVDSLQRAVDAADSALSTQADHLGEITKQLSTARKAQEAIENGEVDFGAAIESATSGSLGSIEKAGEQSAGAFEQGVVNEDIPGTVKGELDKTKTPARSAGSSAGTAMGNALVSAFKAATNGRLNVKATGTSVFSGLNGSGHATGLARVPYDNYLARLHVNEAVLTAAEAERWRSGKSNMDYNALAAAIASALPASSGQEVVLNVNGREFARATAADTAQAQGDYSRRRARGRGY